MSLSRLLFLAIGGICVVLMSVALYMEYVMGLEPCPLCMLQRGLLPALVLSRSLPPPLAPGMGRTSWRYRRGAGLRRGCDAGGAPALAPESA